MIMPKRREEERNGQNDRKRRNDHTQHRTQAAPIPVHLVSDEHGGIQGQRARRGLGEGQQIEELPLLNPLSPSDNLLFDQRNHGITASEGKDAYFKK